MKSTQVKVIDLMADDYFKLAGQIYRIVRVVKNAFGDRVIEFYPVAGKSRHSTLIMPKKAYFKIYNQG